MNRYACIFGLLALFSFGCSGSDEAFDADARVQRGTVQALSGSCINACGAKSESGNCWCDSQCEQYGDCCGDKADFCSADMGDKKPTCEGACGGASNNANCWCDEACANYGDCCEDSYLCEAPAPECTYDGYCEGICGSGPPVTLDPGCLPMSCLCAPPCAEDPEASYISNNLDQCATLKFACDVGFAPFNDECGCGCKPVTVPAAQSCQDACGSAASDGSCYCDALCESYGDCCGDVQVWCADRQLASGQCVGNSMDECSSDSDCNAGGCGGELCYNPDVSSGISTCACFGPGVEVTGCGCVQGKCSWYN